MDPHRRTVPCAPGAPPEAAGPPRARAEAHPVRLVVGFPQDGPLDLAARAMAPALAARLGQEVVVENRLGASGNTATREVVRAAPDGRTLLLCAPVQAINATLFPGLDFDFAQDIQPIVAMASVPLVVEVHPGVPVRTLPEFLALARERPGAIRVAYAGIGTPQHIGLALFQHLAGVRLTLVPYPGSAAALADLTEGRVDAMFDPAPSSMPHLKAGRLVPLATTGPARAPMLPAVPAVADYVPGYTAGSWFGLGAPRATPADAVARINAAANEALADPATQARLAALGATPMGGTVEDFAGFVRAETARFREIIAVAGIAAQPG